MKWSLLKSKNNIASYSGTPYEDGVTPTKVEMTVKATAEKTVRAITDMANYKTWVPYCITSTLLQRNGDSIFYGYQRVSAPFVKDRDLALCCTITRKGDKAYEILIVAVPTFVKTIDKAIRIKHLRTHYDIYQDATGITHLVQISEVNIGGSIPMFLLNWLSKYQPYETCEKLRSVMEGTIKS